GDVHETVQCNRPPHTNAGVVAAVAVKEVQAGAAIELQGGLYKIVSRTTTRTISKLSTRLDMNNFGVAIVIIITPVVDAHVNAGMERECVGRISQTAAHAFHGPITS